MARNILQVRAWQARYGRAQVLFDVSLEVGEGEVVTLLGRNGMGRSTTVKCLFGMLPITAGSFAVDGAPVAGLPSHRIARLGLALVPEGRQVFSQLTVEENLLATARATRPDARGPWNLDRVYRLFPRLRERRTNLGWQLSGGEQQMLAIGRALMTNPRLLVLDEATEGLAPIVRDEIWRTLAVLKDEGLAQIVIDKHLAPLLKLAHRHYIIERGRIVWEGDSRSLSEDAQIKGTYLGV
jgi:branched-chain amino acid transport system ATP-binding protein